MAMDAQAEIVRVCRSWVSTGAVSAVAVEVCADTGDVPILEARAGEARRDGSPVEEDSLFDLASLTKPWTATLALWLDERGDLPLATRVGDVWPDAASAMAQIELEALLRHRAGLARWRPLYALCRTPEEVAERMLSGEWLEPRRESRPMERYSDLDYLLWSLTAEHATGRRYDELLSELATRLGGADLAFHGSSAAAERGVYCGLSTAREVELAADLGLAIDEQPPPQPGQAQDGNVRFFERAVGHAGLFGSVAAIRALAREWLMPGRVLSRGAVESALGGEGRYALGWFRGAETAAGRVAAQGASGVGTFGHDGFTGGTVWIQPAAGRATVMLAHRSSPAIDLSAARADLLRLAGALRGSRGGVVETTDSGSGSGQEASDGDQ